ncbi:GatB/YqeY domain-containing protein [Candidatus Azambacteria bacterium]|nr:GatB/YqeY domain-containing protein [Candidatus Azambacteria bacterium]MBI3685295.1 GatB/YqeY domain-containing protein [Candidatus Azambacteria bacterium]
MTLYEQIGDQFKQAMKSGDVTGRSVLVMLKSAITNKAIEKKKKDAPVSDEDVMDAVVSEIKKRRDSAAQYKTAGRDDLAKKEEEEIAVLMRFLPPQLSESEVRTMIADAITKTGAATAKDTGKVLAALTGQMKGRTDMSAVAKIVKEKLSE